jgi:2-phosphosulfolactate phosphatase
MHDRRLNVHPLPALVAESALAGGTTVVIDLLRATSTICQALASGAVEVVPFLEVDEALSAAAKAPDRENIVLGGERGGRRIEGFDLGNSPTEYTPRAVGGKRVFITTTNGTRALHHAKLARRVVIGSLLNLSAVVVAVEKESQVDVLCAGTDGRVTGEDLLAAGAIASRLGELSKARLPTNDSAASAANYWAKVQNLAELSDRSVTDELLIILRGSCGGQNLIEIGMARDVDYCAQIDRLHVLPELDLSEWRIVLR